MKEKITFANLVDKIAEETGSSKQLVHAFLHETVILMKEGLGREGHVNIMGLGRFQLKWHNARSGRNPQTGDSIEIPAHNTVNYKPASDLLKHINREYAHLQAEIIDEGKRQVLETLITEPEVKERIVPPSFTESSKTKSENKKQPHWWLWILIGVLMIIFAYLIWNFLVKPETENEPLVTEKVEEAVIEQSVVTETVEDEPIEVEIPVGTPGGNQSVKPGDNLWTITQSYYNKANLWPNTFRVNLSEIENPDILVVDQILKLPPLEGKVGSLTHNDSANITEGNIQVYLAYKKLNKSFAKNYLWVASLYDVDNKLSHYKDKIDKNDLRIIKGMKMK